MPSRTNCRGTRSRSLDWPLSRAEKQGHIMRLYQADVEAANCQLQLHTYALREKENEIRRLSVSRSSEGSKRSSECSNDRSRDDRDASTDVVADEESLIGTWFYNKARSSYNISRSSSGALIFKEHDWCGTLQEESGWYVVELPKGTIRLKLTSVELIVVSQWMPDGSTTWGEEIFAIRQQETESPTCNPINIPVAATSINIPVAPSPESKSIHIPMAATSVNIPVSEFMDDEDFMNPEAATSVNIPVGEFMDEDFTRSGEDPMLAEERSSSKRVVCVQEDAPSPTATVKCTGGIRFRKDMTRSRSLPSNRFQNQTDLQKPWLASAWTATRRGIQRSVNDLKDFSKAFLEELAPGGTEGDGSASDAAQRQVETIQFTVEMHRGEGKDRKKLGVSLSETPENQPLAVAAVIPGLALATWNASELPVRLKMFPGDRETVIRKIAVQPGDEISEIDGLPINMGPDDDFRRTVERRMRKCTRLTIQRRIKPRSETSKKGAPGANVRVAAQAGGA